jgi:ribosomal protein S18 acetylase RimI-like enzyme
MDEGISVTPFRTDPSPVVRIAVRKDLPALTALLKALFSIEEDFVFDEEKQRRGLSIMLDGCGKHRRTLVAELSGEVVGMCSVQILISTAEGAEAAVVEDVVVREDSRGCGIGTALMEAVVQWAGNRNIRRFQLLADRNNTAAIEFYRSRGWDSTQLICLRKRL